MESRLHDFMESENQKYFIEEKHDEYFNNFTEIQQIIEEKKRIKQIIELVNILNDNIERTKYLFDINAFTQVHKEMLENAMSKSNDDIIKQKIKFIVHYNLWQLILPNCINIVDNYNKYTEIQPYVSMLINNPYDTKLNAELNKLSDKNKNQSFNFKDKMTNLFDKLTEMLLIDIDKFNCIQFNIVNISHYLSKFIKNGFTNGGIYGRPNLELEQNINKLKEKNQSYPYINDIQTINLNFIEELQQLDVNNKNNINLINLNISNIHLFRLQNENVLNKILKNEQVIDVTTLLNEYYVKFEFLTIKAIKLMQKAI